MNYIIYLVVFLVTIIEVAISFSSPNLPAIRQEFGVSEEIVQLTISLELVGLALSGLFYGVLSDCWGRRPVILMGLGIFCFSSLLCAWAPTIELLILARFLQGLGSGVAWTVGTAAIKDAFVGDHCARMISTLNICGAITPAVAPILGGIIGAYWGWRYGFELLFWISFSAFLVQWFTFPETLKTFKTYSWQRLLKSYQGLMLNSSFMTYTAIKSLLVAQILVDVSCLPFVFIEGMGVLQETYGYYIALGSGVYMIAGVFNTLWIRRQGVDKLLLTGLTINILSNFISSLVILFVPLSAFVIQLARVPFYVSLAFVYGNATTRVLESAPNQAGAAAALMVSLEMVVSSIGIYLVSLIINGTLWPLILFNFVSGILAVGTLAVRRNYELRSASEIIC